MKAGRKERGRRGKEKVEMAKALIYGNKNWHT